MRVRTTPYQLVLPPRTSSVPSSHWLREALRSGIRSGMLGPGQRMPATREIARLYGLSRGTVLKAIDDLKAEGYVRGVPGSGTYVCDLLPDKLQPEQSALEVPKPVPGGDSPRLSDFAKILEPFPYFANPVSLAFRTNLPALDLFPTTLWAQVASRRLRRVSTTDLLGRHRGYGPLRQLSLNIFERNEASDATLSKSSLFREFRKLSISSLRLLVNPGDRVLLAGPRLSDGTRCISSRGSRPGVHSY